MIIETKDLGFAAFIKMSGLKLIACESRVFKFESERVSEGTNIKSELEVAYANSCCREHDSNIMFLRQLL